MKKLIIASMFSLFSIHGLAAPMGKQIKVYDSQLKKLVNVNLKLESKDLGASEVQLYSDLNWAGDDERLPIVGTVTGTKTKYIFLSSNSTQSSLCQLLGQVDFRPGYGSVGVLSRVGDYLGRTIRNTKIVYFNTTRQRFELGSDGGYYLSTLSCQTEHKIQPEPKEQSNE